VDARQRLSSSSTCKSAKSRTPHRVAQPHGHTAGPHPRSGAPVQPW
jgi:hypothetical protein